MVSGSPIIGTHANNNDQIPYFLKKISLFAICVSLAGNHFLSLKIKIFFPKYQFIEEPKIFPKLAIIKSKYLSNVSVSSIVVKTNSEDSGSIVAARKLISNNCKYEMNIIKSILLKYMLQPLKYLILA